MPSVKCQVLLCARLCTSGAQNFCFIQPKLWFVGLWFYSVLAMLSMLDKCISLCHSELKVIGRCSGALKDGKLLALMLHV